MKTLKRWRLSITILALAATTSGAFAGQAVGCEQISAVESYIQAGATPKGATCDTFLDRSSKVGISCYWEFPYRDNSAKRMANQLWGALRKCRTGKHLPPDLRVNHPDSFQLREWRTKTATYRVSLKDKAGQGRTLVFFGFSKF